MTRHPRQSPPDEYRQQQDDLRRRTDWETSEPPDPNWEKRGRPDPSWEPEQAWWLDLGPEPRQVVRALSAIPRLSRHR